MHKKSNNRANLSPSSSFVGRSYAEQLLLQRVKGEIQSRLQNSLYSAGLNQFSKQERAEKQNHLWNLEILTISQPEKLLPEMGVLEIFQSTSIEGKLCILGSQGSGKTTIVLELAQELIQQAEIDPSYPVPVVFDFPLKRFESQSVLDWLVDDLKSRYGINYGKKGDSQENYLALFRLLPLLDGLNAPPYYVQDVNEWLQSSGCPSRLVICSKWEQFGKPDVWPPDKLIRLSSLKGTLLLKPSANESIQTYLDSLNCSSVWLTLQQDDNLLDIVRIPFWLNIVVLIHENLILGILKS